MAVWLAVGVLGASGVGFGMLYLQRRGGWSDNRRVDVPLRILLGVSTTMLVFGVGNVLVYLADKD